MNSIIVIDCGFCGSNIVVEMLMEFNYYMGEYWVKSNKRMHPHSTLEDHEFHHAQQMLDSGFDWYLQDVIKRREQFFGNRWGFVAANNFKYLDTYRSIFKNWGYDPFKLIACVGDRPTLVSYMHKHWTYTHIEANQRIKDYLGVVKEYKKLVPTLVINQNLLRKDADVYRKRIQSFASSN